MSDTHSWESSFLPKPTWCCQCSQFIWGLTKETQRASICRKCVMVVHAKCVDQANYCPGNNYFKHNKKLPPPNNRKPPTPTTQENHTLAKVPSVSQQETTQAERCLAEAMFDFPPENDRELRLKKGDIIEVYQISGEWWFGALEGSSSEGYFPGAYVKKIGNWNMDST